MNKKWVTLAGLGILLLGGGFWAYKHFTAKPAVATLIKGTVQRGDVKKVITATGTVDYQNVVTLSFDQPGKLVALNVQAGDTVKKGQVLAELDTSDLQTAVEEAKNNLASAEANYKQTVDSQGSSLLSNYSNALQQLTNAQNALETAKRNADPGYLANQVNLAQQKVTSASNDLAAAQAKAAQSGNDSGVQAAQQALTQAQNDLANALYQQNGGASQALTQAQSAYEAAQANFEQAKKQVQQYQAGQPTTNLLAQQAALSAAQTKLATAEKNLANAKLIAPDDGMVISVPVNNYQSVADNTTVMTLVTGSKVMKVDAAVDQADIWQVKVGQKADITLDAQPDQHMSGTVTAVALKGTTTQNVTTYGVTVVLDTETDLLKAGMNANVAIIVAEAQNVLTVPSEAVHGSGTRAIVLVPGAAPGENTGVNAGNGRAGSQGNNSANGTNGSNNGAQSGAGTGRGTNGSGFNMAGIDAHPVPVEIGLDDGTNVEIKNGLTEGQEIVVSVRTATTTSPSSSTGFGQPRTSGGTENPGRAMGQFNRAIGGR